MTDTDQESCHWRRLTPDLVRRIAACAHPNAFAGSLKLTDSETAAALRGSYNVLQLLQRSTRGNEHALPFAKADWPGHVFVAHWGRPEPWHSLNLFRRRRLLCLATSSGHAASLEASLAHCGCSLTPEVLASAAMVGNLEGCERLLQQDSRALGLLAFSAAAEAGQLSALQWLIGRAHAPDMGAASALSAAAQGACKGGQPHILDWLRQAHGYRPSKYDAMAAARAGHVAVMEQLISLVPDYQYDPLEAGVAHAALMAEAAGDAGGVAGADAAAEVVPLSDRARLVRRNRWKLLEAIAEGCPLQVLQWHHGWLWCWWWGFAAIPSSGHAATQAGGRPKEAGAWGEGVPEQYSMWELQQQAMRQEEFARQDQELGKTLVNLLHTAAGSPTPCWASKVDYLLAAWGPAVAGEVLSGERGAAFDWPAAAQPNFMVRLKHLQKCGMPMEEEAVLYAAQGGHVEALSYLWDECRVHHVLPETHSAFLFQTLLRPKHRPVGPELLHLIQARGVVLAPLHAKSSFLSEEGLLYLTEVALGQEEAAGNPDGDWGEAGSSQQLQPEHDGKPAQRWSTSTRDGWSGAFTHAAHWGASLRVLQALHARGAGLDLAAVAYGGSREALDWAAAELQVVTQAGTPYWNACQALTQMEARSIMHAGNTMALAWLQFHGLL